MLNVLTRETGGWLAPAWHPKGERYEESNGGLVYAVVGIALVASRRAVFQGIRNDGEAGMGRIQVLSLGRLCR